VGKHTGSFFGVPATNKEMSLIILEWDVFDEEGRFVESWARYDTLDWMKQMGLM
jgi:predicted ester cyclase